MFQCVRLVVYCFDTPLMSCTMLLLLLLQSTKSLESMLLSGSPWVSPNPLCWRIAPGIPISFQQLPAKYMGWLICCYWLPRMWQGRTCIHIYIYIMYKHWTWETYIYYIYAYIHIYIHLHDAFWSLDMQVQILIMVLWPLDFQFSRGIWRLSNVPPFPKTKTAGKKSTSGTSTWKI